MVMIKFGLKCFEVIEWRRNLYNWKLRDMYPSPTETRIIKSKRRRWAGHVALIWKKKPAYRLLAGKPNGRRPIRRKRSTLVDTTKVDLGETG
jgi:hypothetical protein